MLFRFCSYSCEVRLTRDELIWKALLALDELVEQSEAAQVPKSLMLRFTLAYLYSNAAPDSRPVFNEIWRLMTAPCPQETYARGTRSANIGAAYNGLCRAIGWERTVTLMQYLAASRRLEGKIGDSGVEWQAGQHE